MNLIKRVLGGWYDNTFIRMAFEVIFVIVPIAFLIRTFGFGLYQVPTESMETTLLAGERFFADKLSYWVRKPQRGEIVAMNCPIIEYSPNTFINLWQRYISWNVENWTKRVIGIPGDHVQGVIEQGTPVVYVNEKKLDESNYLNKYPLIVLWKTPEELRRSHGRCQWNLRSIDPRLPYDKQPFYTIDSRLLVKDEVTREPKPLIYPGTPIPQDVFDVKLQENQYWVMGDNRLGSGDSREWGPLDGNLIHGRIVFRIWSADSTESWWFIDLLRNPMTFWKKIRWRRCCQPVY